MVVPGDFPPTGWLMLNPATPVWLSAWCHEQREVVMEMMGQLCPLLSEKFYIVKPTNDQIIAALCLPSRVFF